LHDTLSIRTLFAIALLALAVIAFQVNLIQIFSYIQWYHFAYMAISIALLGFGIAGTLLTLFRDRLIANYYQLFPILCFLAGIAMALIMLLIGAVKLVEVHHVSLSATSLSGLAGFYFLLVIPFLFAALAIGLTFVKYADHIGKLYFFDLAGSGLGALIIVSLSSLIFPEQLGILCAIAPFISGLITSHKVSRMRNWFWTVVGGIILVAGFYSVEKPIMSEYKALSKARLLPDALVHIRKPTTQGVIEVLSSPALRDAPGLSLSYPGKVPVIQGVYKNGEWIGPIGNQKLEDSIHVYDYTTQALPFIFNMGLDVLVFDDPTASLVSYALDKKASHVTLLFESNEIASLTQKEFVVETDSVLYDHNVRPVKNRMRSFLANDKSKYDLIVLPVVGQFGSSGLHAIREIYALTLENLSLVWDHLNPHGMIAITSWQDASSKSPLRLFNLLMGTLYNQGIDNPLDHLVAIQSWSQVTFLVKKSDWGPSDYDRISSFCNVRQFDPLINNARIVEDDSLLHKSGDSTFLAMMHKVILQDKESIQAFDFNILNPTDDKPFFYQFLKISRLEKLYRVHGNQSFFLEMGYLIVLFTLLFVCVAAALFILLPLLKIGFTGPSRSFTLFHFSAIGIGFMFIEIAFINKCIPFLGSPVYAFSSTLAALLITSGIGSYLSEFLRDPLARIRQLSLILVLLILVYNVFSDSLWMGIVKLDNFSLPAAILVIGIPGVFMGMFFPLGIRYLNHQDTLTMIPWAWGINGFFSVISAVLATILAVEIGYSGVVYLAAAAYSITFVTSFSRRH
jgi:hypothetical protein